MNYLIIVSYVILVEGMPLFCTCRQSRTENTANVCMEACRLQSEARRFYNRLDINRKHLSHKSVLNRSTIRYITNFILNTR